MSADMSGEKVRTWRDDLLGKEAITAGGETVVLVGYDDGSDRLLALLDGRTELFDSHELHVLDDAPRWGFVQSVDSLQAEMLSLQMQATKHVGEIIDLLGRLNDQRQKMDVERSVSCAQSALIYALERVLAQVNSTDDDSDTGSLLEFLTEQTEVYRCRLKEIRHGAI